MMHQLSKVVCLLIALVLTTVAGVGQVQETRQSPPVYFNGSNNESALAGLDAVYGQLEGDDLLIAIARPGRREAPTAISKLRLQNFARYFETARMIPRKRIVTAVGEPVPGLGVIEVYVKGKLIVIFEFSRNENFGKGG